jgi:hypothetical protein
MGRPLLIAALCLLPSLGWGQSYWSLTSGANAPIWRLNGDANNDGTGDANAIIGTANGTWTGSSAYVDAPAGKGLGKAFDFNGSSNRIDVGAVTGAPTGANVRTIGYWTNVDVFATDNLSAGILAYSTAGGAGTTLEAYAEDGAASVAGNGHRIITTKSALSTGTWYHVAIVVPSGATSTSQILVHLNGSLASTTTESGSAQTLNTGTIAVQVGSTYNTRWFNGRVYDARIYDVALSAGDIAQIVAGPEPTLTSGAITADATGLLTDDTAVEFYGNGSEVTTWRWEFDDDGDWVAVDGRTDQTSGPAAWGDAVTGNYRLVLIDTNDGGSLETASASFTYTAPAAFSRIGSPRIGSPRVIPLNL